MALNGSKSNIFILLYFIISNLRNEVVSSVLDCILTLYVPRLKNAVKVIKELRTFLLIAKKCIKSRNFIPIAEKLANMATDLAIATEYQDTVSVFAINDANVSLLINNKNINN